MLTGKSVALACRIATIGLRGEIGVGKSKVRLVGFKVRSAIDEFQSRLDRRVRCCVNSQASTVILSLETGVGVGKPINRLEAVAALLVGFKQRADVVRVSTDPGLSLIIVARPVLPGGEARQPVGRNVGRPKIDRPANRTGPIANGCSAFCDLDRLHASDGREIIRCRRGIGSRRDQHAVFHERDVARTFDRTAAQTDIREQAEPVFLLRVDAGDLPQDAIYIPVIEPAQILAVDKIGRSRDTVGIDPAADHDDRIHRILPALVCNLFGAHLSVIRPGSLLCHRRCGQSDCEGRDGSTIHKNFLFSECGNPGPNLIAIASQEQKHALGKLLGSARARSCAAQRGGFATPMRQGCGDLPELQRVSLRSAVFLCNRATATHLTPCAARSFLHEQGQADGKPDNPRKPELGLFNEHSYAPKPCGRALTARVSGFSAIIVVCRRHRIRTQI